MKLSHIGLLCSLLLLAYSSRTLATHLLSKRAEFELLENGGRFGSHSASHAYTGPPPSLSNIHEDSLTPIPTSHIPHNAPPLTTPETHSGGSSSSSPSTSFSFKNSPSKSSSDVPPSTEIHLQRAESGFTTSQIHSLENQIDDPSHAIPVNTHQTQPPPPLPHSGSDKPPPTSWGKRFIIYVQGKYRKASWLLGRLRIRDIFRKPKRLSENTEILQKAFGGAIHQESNQIAARIDTILSDILKNKADKLAQGDTAELRKTIITEIYQIALHLDKVARATRELDKTHEQLNTVFRTISKGKFDKIARKLAALQSNHLIDFRVAVLDLSKNSFPPDLYGFLGPRNLLSPLVQLILDNSRDAFKLPPGFKSEAFVESLKGLDSHFETIVRYTDNRHAASIDKHVTRLPFPHEAIAQIQQFNTQYDKELESAGGLKQLMANIRKDENIRNFNTDRTKPINQAGYEFAFIAPLGILRDHNELAAALHPAGKIGLSTQIGRLHPALKEMSDLAFTNAQIRVQHAIASIKIDRELSQTGLSRTDINAMAKKFQPLKSK